MPNVLVRKTAHLDIDPFAQSDRPDARPFDRSAHRRFRENFDKIFAPRKSKPEAKPTSGTVA